MTETTVYLLLLGAMCYLCGFLDARDIYKRRRDRKGRFVV